VPVSAPKVDGRVIDNRPALAADPDGPPDCVGHVEVTGRAAGVVIALVADTSEDRRRSAFEPRCRLKLAEGAADRPVGSDLPATSEVAIDEPGAERRGPECIDLGTATDLDPGVKATVGRPEEGRGLGEAQQRLDGSLALEGIIDCLAVRCRINHGDSGSW